MNKTVKMLIGITAGLALLLGPTAVYAGKGNNNKEKGRGDQKVKVESEREKTNKSEKTNTKSDNEDSFNDTRIKDSGNDNSTTCTVNVLAGCAKGSGVIAGGKGGVLNELLDDGINLDNVLNELLEEGPLDCEIDDPNLTGAASVSVERQQDRTIVDVEAHPGEPTVDADCD
jgi:hypothetical protein